MFRALVLLPALAFVPQDPGPVTLRFKPPVGSSVTYATSTAMTQTVPGLASPIGTTTTGTMTLRAVSRENGATTLETKTGKAKVTVTGEGLPAGMKERMEAQGNDQTTTTVVDEFGTLKDLRLGASGPGAAVAKQVASGLAPGFQGVAYPQGPLKVGDTWASEIDLGKVLEKSVPGSKGVGKVPITFRLVGVEQAGGATLAKIVTTMKGSATATTAAIEMRMATESTGETVIDVSTGFVRSSAFVGDNDLSAAGQTLHQHIVTTTKALPPASAPQAPAPPRATLGR